MRGVMRGTMVMAALAAALGASAGPAAAQAGDVPQIGQVSKDSVWVPTPERVIRRMLQMADVTADDLVVDLGSGDGRIPIYAGRHFGARAVGVELEENLVRLATESARAQGVADRVRFVRQDLFAYDLSDATVVALYISPGVMTRLEPRLAALRPGTRITSHYFTLGDWQPDETIRVEERTAHLWIVPADVGGTWTVRSGSDVFKVTIDQRHQQLKTRGQRAGRDIPVIAPKIRGTDVSFAAVDPAGDVRHYVGRVAGGRMSGESHAEGAPPARWSAARE
jgi:SAM-dependent methyltransferase